MRSLVLGLALLHVGCAAAPRSAPPPPPAPPAPAPPTAPVGGIFVRPEAGGLHVSYRALPPARTFHFDKAGAAIRKDTWQLVGAGLSFTDEGVAAAAPVGAFELVVAPDARQRDRVYPALTAVGEGWLFYAPHLRIEGASIPDRLSVEAPSAWTLVGRRDARGDLAGDGYVFVGPASYVRHGVADVVGAPSTPAWLLREVEAATGDALSFYERRLGVGLPERVTTVVVHQPDQGGSFHGDTTPGAVMALRFKGPGWSERDAAAVEVLAGFVHHEVFHFWNGEIARSTQQESRPWLHEGGADYAALLVSRARGAMTRERAYAVLNRALERCQDALGRRDLRDHGPNGGNGAYACGTVFAWALDVGLVKTSNGQRDVLTWWKDIVAKARSEGGTYTFEGAYALAPPDATRAAEVLLAAGDDRRWTTFADEARRYGATMSRARVAGRDLGEALDHVLFLHCGKERGFFTQPDHVKLDTGSHCGPLDGDPRVDAVAGFNPVTASSAMYDAVRKLCAAKKTIDFAFKGKIVARAPCTRPLAEPTLGWQIQGDGTGLSAPR